MDVGELRFERAEKIGVLGVIAAVRGDDVRQPRGVAHEPRYDALDHSIAESGGHREIAVVSHHQRLSHAPAESRDDQRLEERGVNLDDVVLADQPRRRARKGRGDHAAADARDRRQPHDAYPANALVRREGRAVLRGEDGHLVAAPHEALGELLGVSGQPRPMRMIVSEDREDLHVALPIGSLFVLAAAAWRATLADSCLVFEMLP